MESHASQTMDREQVNGQSPTSFLKAKYSSQESSFFGPRRNSNLETRMYDSRNLMAGSFDSPTNPAGVARVKNIQLSAKHQKLPILEEENPFDSMIQNASNQRVVNMKLTKT